MTVNAIDVVSGLRERGLEIELIGRCDGGEVGAYVVRTLGDQLKILKWREVSDEVRFRDVAEALERLRLAGYPTPEYEALEPWRGHEVSLQEMLPGEPTDELSPTDVEHLAALNELQADQGVGSTTEWKPMMLRTTLEGGDGWCRHESLEAHSPATRSLWERAAEWADDARTREFPSGDVVHVDFHHRNILRLNGRITGVIDWEGTQCGDRSFDMLTLAFYSGVAGWSDSARRRWIEALASSMETEVARLYVGHLCVRAVDWAIRHHSTDQVSAWMHWSQDALGCLE